jgi:hypothetical protein
MKRLVRLVRRSLLGLAVASAAYLVLLAYPQPLFAHEVSSRGLTIHAMQAMPPAMNTTLDRAVARLQRSPLFAAAGDVHVFLCQQQSVFTLFARQNYRVGGVADWLIGQHAFVRQSDMHNDRLISPSGTPVSADRPLSYFVAHEAMHIAIARAVGRVDYSRMPQWVDDGYADYVARDIDYADALQKLKADARELDPLRSGLYLRYHLMVAYLLDKKRVPLAELLTTPPDRERIEAELLALTAWPSPHDETTRSPIASR